MVHHADFRMAVHVLEGLTTNTPVPHQTIQFGKEYEGQPPLTTALKILHKAASKGTTEQKTELLSSRHKIIALNSLLKKPSCEAEVGNKLGIEIGQGTHEIKGIQIALPKTKFGKMIEVATKIPRIIFTLIIDVMLLPGALALLIAACCKFNFNPKPEEIKVGKIPILLIHGSGFNESEWMVGRQFLKKDQYGSVFSLNYDGLVSNDPKKGIEDYARNQIRAEVKRIKALTGSDQVILIGHSMGGMIAGYYAEHVAKADGVNIEHVISIATPWQGTPMVDCFWKLGGRFSKEKETKRHQQMSLSGGTETDPQFRQTLVAKALESERKGMRKYYNIWSSTDYAVPFAQGSLTEDPRRQRSFSYLGHYGLAVWPSVWLKTRSWLDAIYLSPGSCSIIPNH